MDDPVIQDGDSIIITIKPTILFQDDEMDFSDTPKNVQTEILAYLRSKDLKRVVQGYAA